MKNSAMTFWGYEKQSDVFYGAIKVLATAANATKKFFCYFSS